MIRINQKVKFIITRDINNNKVIDITIWLSNRPIIRDFKKKFISRKTNNYSIIRIPVSYAVKHENHIRYMIDKEVKRLSEIWKSNQIKETVSIPNFTI